MRARPLVLAGVGLLALPGLVYARHAVFGLAFGWLVYLAEVLPRVEPNVPELLLGFGVAAGLVAGGHAFARRVLRPDWPLRWSLLGLGLVVTMFGTTMASAGVAHNLGWMVRYRANLLRPTGGPAALLDEACGGLEETGEGLRFRSEAAALELEWVTLTGSTSEARHLAVPRSEALLAAEGFVECAAGTGRRHPAAALSAALAGGRDPEIGAAQPARAVGHARTPRR